MQRATISCDLSKTSVNQLNENIAHGQLRRLGQKAIGTTLMQKGWKVERVTITYRTNGDGYTYTGSLKFRKTTNREYPEQVFDKQWADIKRKLASGGKAINWFPCFHPTANVSLPPAIAPVASPTAPIEVNLPTDYMQFFTHLYGLDAQIRIIYDAIHGAKRTNFIKRNAVICWGPPGSGKTDTLLAFRTMLGEKVAFSLDATMLTKAGAEKLLLELETPPPILIIEEIEKCNPLNLPWLLSVMDQRAEIHKVNARTVQGGGQGIRRKVHSLVLATANDYAEFKRIMSGALASRFKHPVPFPRPSREVLEKILLREIKEIKGNPKWIQPALDYALEVEHTNDPRRVMAILDGGDRLITGEYQADLASILAAIQQEQE